MNIKQEFNELKKGSNKKLVLAILFLTVILFVYFYFGSASAFEKYFSNIENVYYWKVIYHNCMSFLLFFGVGFVWSKFVLKNKISQMGLGQGQWKFGLKICAIATIVVPLVALSAVLDSQMVATYPLIDFATYSQWYFILGYFVSYLLYYIGWEFLFRSIGLFSCEESCGALGAIAITTMISALVHSSIAGFGKPLVETLSAIPAGFIFGFITIKTKSIWYSLYIHCLVGFLTDVFILLIA